jgi:hypothetical protein
MEAQIERFKAEMQMQIQAYTAQMKAQTDAKAASDEGEARKAEASKQEPKAEMPPIHINVDAKSPSKRKIRKTKDGYEVEDA